MLVKIPSMKCNKNPPSESPVACG